VAPLADLSDDEEDAATANAVAEKMKNRRRR
jgi:hypothetical protein